MYLDKFIESRSLATSSSVSVLKKVMLSSRVALEEGDSEESFGAEKEVVCTGGMGGGVVRTGGMGAGVVCVEGMGVDTARV